jgi:hypothetical protein
MPIQPDKNELVRPPRVMPPVYFVGGDHWHGRTPQLFSWRDFD